MRSVTSCFNSILYRKTMARFWPMWALYSVLWLFICPLLLLNEYFDTLRYSTLEGAQTALTRMARELPEMLQPGVWLSCLAGVLAAMAVFGYLYNNRSAAMIHGLPMRRDALFFTQYLAGLSFLLLPLLAACVLAALVEVILLPTDQWGSVLSALGTLLLGQAGTSLFFFSFAAFCAMFTGHVLALPAFYGILNALVSVIYYLTITLMDYFFYGFSGSNAGESLVELLTPVWALTEACIWNIEYMARGEGVIDEIKRCYLESPGMILGYAIAGLVLAAVALLVYRRRHVESAGDVVSVPVVRPIFRCGVSFCSGLCFGMYTVAFFGWTRSPLLLTGAVLAWTAVGYFAAEMLLKKSFRVFKAWKGCLVMVVVAALLCAACFNDWFGIENKVPKADQVAVVNLTGSISYPSDDGRFDLIHVTDPQIIQQVIDLHQAIVDDKGRGDETSLNYTYGDERVGCHITYTMENGSTLTRRYWAPIFHGELEQEGSVTWQLNQMIQNRELIREAYNFDFYDGSRIVDAWLEGVAKNGNDLYESLYLDGTSGQDLEGLWQAVKQDFAQGTIGVRYLFDDNQRRANTYVTDLHFEFEVKETEDGKVVSSHTPSSQVVAYSRSFTITLTPQAENTLAWLEYHNVLGDQYQLMEHDLYEQGKSFYLENGYADYF